MKKFSKIGGYPPELIGRINSFIVTEFDDSMTVEMQMRVLIKWIMKNIDLTNDMVDYLNEFIEKFDEKLYKTLYEILDKFVNDGLLDNHIKEEIEKFLIGFTKYNRVQEYVNNSIFNPNRFIPDYYVKRLNELAERTNTFNKDNLNQIFFTDNHNQYTQYAPNSLAHGEYAATLTNMCDIDTLIMGGDNANGWYEKTEIINELIAITSVCYNLSNLKTDTFILNGNHDNGAYQNGKTKPSQIISNDELKQIFRTKSCVFEEKRNGDSLYCFKDYPDKKYRVFFLDNFDFYSNETNADGTIRWNNLTESGYGETQLKWFASNLKETPSDYHVIVYQHAPMLDIFNDQVQYNGDVFKAILKAYKLGTPYSIKEPERPKPIELDIDFTGREGVIACVVNGHLHQDLDTTWEDILCISTGASLCFSGDTWRVVDTYTEDCWDLMSYNHDNRTIECLRFGYGADRTFTY